MSKILQNSILISIFFAASFIQLKSFPERSEKTNEYLTYKTTPILTLVCLAGLNGGVSTKYQNTYAKRIFFGLALSALADVVICFEEYFLIAVGLFAFVHILYTTSFGFRPLKMPLGILVYILMFGMASHILPQIKLFELKIAFPLYMLLIMTMLWRALAKINLKNIRTVHVIIALGAISFVISDVVLCIDSFIKKIAYGNFWILLTYYIAQFGIALSTVYSTGVSELNINCMFNSNKIKI